MTGEQAHNQSLDIFSDSSIDLELMFDDGQSRRPSVDVGVVTASGLKYISFPVDENTYTTLEDMSVE
jgi:hypothetical protein